MKYYWKAVYDDGSEFPQYNVDGSENLYYQIKRKRLSKFILLQVNSDKVFYVLHFTKPWQRLICRRRIVRPLVPMTKDEQDNLETVWLIGQIWNHKGQQQQKLAFIFEDGHIEERDNFKEKSQFYYACTFVLENKLDEM